MSGQKNVAIVRRERSHEEANTLATTRLRPIAEALRACGLRCETVLFREERAEEFEKHLAGADAALVFVDPISDGRDRSLLDDVLRNVSRAGTWISAHPDVILRMGTKEVLYETRELSWATDTEIYRSVVELRRRFPAQLLPDRPRVLKQQRGNAGEGVWKVALRTEAPARLESIVEVQHAHHRGSATEDLPLGKFLDRCNAYFEGSGLMVDQAFQARVDEGMIRAYVVDDHVIGFARQTADGLEPADGLELGEPRVPRTPPDRVFGLASEKTMFPASAPQFAPLKRSLESEWIPGMLAVLGLSSEDLPALWDADFLFGPMTETRKDTYVLCEINVSCVTPFPPQAAGEIAASVARRLGRGTRQRTKGLRGK